jgi:multiple sugar transport system ATP-binding protein
MIYVTHDQVEAMTMGSRICIMNHGKVVQIGPPLEVYGHPADTFVARFLGNPPMNLVAAELSAGDAPQVRLGHHVVPLVGHAGRLEAHGGPVVFGVRPEDLYESDPGTLAETVALPALVTSVEPLGAETLLYLRLENVGEELVARVGRDSRARVGDPLAMTIDLRATHVFDVDTTRSLSVAAAQGS